MQNISQRHNKTKIWTKYIININLLIESFKTKEKLYLFQHQLSSRASIYNLHILPYLWKFKLIEVTNDATATKIFPIACTIDKIKMVLKN